MYESCVGEKQSAFIGLGLMGAPMAANLVRTGHALMIKDLHRVEIAGAQLSEDPARNADIIFTSLPGSKEVEAVAGKTLARELNPLPEPRR